MDKNAVDQKIGMFAQECLGEIGELWSLRIYNSLDIQKYQADVIYRWFTRLEQFVQRGGDPSLESKSADKYLKQVVDELPAATRCTTCVQRR